MQSHLGAGVPHEDLESDEDSWNFFNGLPEWARADARADVPAIVFVFRYGANGAVGTLGQRGEVAAQEAEENPPAGKGVKWQKARSVQDT